MKITILSGGSGNDKLIRGLRRFFPQCEIKVITNAYDSGKSTGICRHVTNTLGVSDIRKNHSRMYETLDIPKDNRILEFYNNRYDLTKGNEEHEVLDLLDGWGLSGFKQYAVNFFSRDLASNFVYKDFSIANIIYSEMYAELGYEETNARFCNFLGIEDFVVLNSFENVYLKAMTQSGHIIGDEGDLVKYDNAEDKIVNTFYTGLDEVVNMKAVDLVKNCDLLVISTGTFWSSIYPTLQYGDFYKYVNESPAKKIWAINNIEDHDCWGVTSNDLINYMTKLGLNLDDFTILENLDSIDTLHLDNDKYNIVKKHMENVKGKHNPEKYAKALLSIFYGIENYNYYDTILFDFDDTIYSRLYKGLATSIENVKMVNDILKDKAIIVSGNSYSSIDTKLKFIYGSDLSCINFDIWADANSRLFRKGKEEYALKNLKMMHPDTTKNILSGFNLPYTSESDACIKVKPLDERERRILAAYLNIVLEDSAEARITGKTTIDIVSRNNSKSAIFDFLNLKDKITLYIGDEVDKGNDVEISSLCTKAIHTSGVEETNVLLQLLCEG